jgi:hypothetical protein
MGSATSARIAQQIHSDLRVALRLRDELSTPLNSFLLDPGRPVGRPRFFVVFDTNPRKLGVQGLIVGGIQTLQLDDEPIINKTLEFAGKVWHLKDKLAKYAKAKQIPLNVDAHVNQHERLCIIADLSNANKHGENKNRSGLKPEILQVRFDTSKSGGIELFLDGASQDKEVIVAKKVPIPFTVDLHVADNVVFGDAVQIISDALSNWLPIIEQTGLLADGSDRLVTHLRDRLNLPPLKS